MQPLLVGWTNFYVVLGTSAGGLIGLQFVVMTLLAGTQVQSSMKEVRAFGSPTVVHFCVALLVSVVMLAPWHDAAPLSAVLIGSGLVCVGYSVRTIWHARASSYNPDLEDWIWYTGLPLVVYFGVTAAGVAFLWHPLYALVGVAACPLALLFIGIHNAWDTITYITTGPRAKKNLTEGE